MSNARNSRNAHYDPSRPSPFATMPRDLMESLVVPHLAQRDLLSLMRVNQNFRGMWTPFQRARMHQAQFVAQRHHEYFRMVAVSSFAPLVERAAQEIGVDSTKADKKVDNVLYGIRQVVFDLGTLTREEQPAKVRSLVLGLGFDDILSTDASFMSPQYSPQITKDAVRKLMAHYGSSWGPYLIKGLMERNPIHWHMLATWDDPEDTDVLIEKIREVRGLRAWIEGPKRARDIGWGWADRADEYLFAKDHLIPPGPRRPFAFRELDRFTKPQFRARFSYDQPGPLEIEPNYEVTEPGEGARPPGFLLKPNHTAPW